MAASKEGVARAKRIARTDTVLPQGDFAPPEQSKTAEVAKFRKRFHLDRDIDEVFTCGCCYWFAVILHQRFPDSRIMYDIISNHFVTEIGGRLYDITGDITGKYNAIPWDSFKNTDYGEKIIRNCVNFWQRRRICVAEQNQKPMSEEADTLPPEICTRRGIPERHRPEYGRHFYRGLAWKD